MNFRPYIPRDCMDDITPELSDQDLIKLSEIKGTSHKEELYAICIKRNIGDKVHLHLKSKSKKTLT